MIKRMSLLSRWLRQRGLAVRQFLFLFLVTSLLFVLLGWINWTESKKLWEEQAASDAQALAGRTNQLIDAYLDNVQNLLLLLAAREDREQLLADGNETWATQALENLERTRNAVARSFFIVRQDGKVYSNSQVFYDIMGNPHLEKLYELSQAQYGAINSEPYWSPLSGQSVGYVQPIYGKTGQKLGIAVAEIDLQLLTQQIAQLLLSKNQSFAIVTKKNNVITSLQIPDRLLPYEPGVYPPQLQSGFVRKLSELPAGVSPIDGAIGPLVAVKTSPNRLGWSLYLFIEQQYFDQHLLKLYEKFRYIALIWISLLLISTCLMSRYFTSPVRKLAAKMDRVRDVEVLSPLNVNREDEIGRLAHSYNELLERIQQLLQETKNAERRKKEYELKMLQSQIAPHFLYNTLACVSSLARQRKTDEVRETIKSLVGLLSFSFDKSTEFVTLAEELEGLNRYAQIQQIRYGDKFRLLADVEPAALEARTLKLTLQPLVENSIFHGLAPRKAPGTILVRGRITARGTLRLTIRDTGIGMDAAQIRRVWEPDGRPRSRQRFTGIGVKNVHERIRLHYGERYGLRIASRPGIGTVVRIEMPFEPMPEGVREAFGPMPLDS
ncbi:histidine kinase [Paenibacillus sp. 32O-W]|uniref:cache domain-containing sensor histidine kinase n=1 Tax=Paenibacillus sp. 32O-W TaxID=1695218 RepID=UPI00071FE3B9|nr:sensor histidine kinase [Paenibacillus sp. 32O-W]ALS26270.1 histidine kinase [Paenibacillus sp. 32O-W]